MEADLERFAAARFAAGGVTWISLASITLPLEYLRTVGAVRRRLESLPTGPFAEVLGAYGSGDLYVVPFTDREHVQWTQRMIFLGRSKLARPYAPGIEANCEQVTGPLAFSL
ncbi:hypothetical protein [Nonomuraea sp. NPDC049400]|uniref:hypothetical protein n=1 Tax=Nonomuraea sp. NPDC049400 TaxID=3364352 RepID=UPI00378DA5EE